MKIVILVSVLLVGLFVLWSLNALPLFRDNAALPNLQLIALSEQLLWNVKTETSTHEVELKLARIKMPELISGLSNDQARKSFWINVYNAWYQILAIREKKAKPDIFTEKLITVAETAFSLDDIEHGILRKYRWKLGLGYLPQFFPSRTIKQLSVSKLDYRVHFALNCGARSCPPIAFYSYEDLEAQLETATSVFLNTDTEIDSENQEVRLSRILQWFKGDFGGVRGIKKLLFRYLDDDVTGYSIGFKEYDWDESLRNFSEEIQSNSEITCPRCGHKKDETMPVDACQIYYVCENCNAVLRPLEGDCCVFCSYGSVKCPSKQ